MDSTPTDIIKQREICFRGHDPGADEASEATRLLQGIDGIEETLIANLHCIQLRYDLRRITLQIIEDALTELGFHLDNSLLAKMKRTLLYYTEETQLMNLGYQHDQAHSTADIFINNYNQREHGCRDERPPHLRRYS
jgi:hypothetical protein